jgi:hypothetical protein
MNDFKPEDRWRLEGLLATWLDEKFFDLTYYDIQEA